MLRSLFFILILMTGCAHKNNSPASSPTEKAVTAVGGPHFTTLEFEKGETSLSRLSQEHLSALRLKAMRSGKEIEEIKVLAWADQEYPDKVQGRAPTSEVILANDRAKVIKSYLKDDFKNSPRIDAFNMAKRPALVSKLVRGEEFRVKEEFENAGATGTRLNDGSLSYSKASKAIVIINYQEETKK